jgi:hypothetical protein
MDPQAQTLWSAALDVAPRCLTPRSFASGSPRSRLSAWPPTRSRSRCLTNSAVFGSARTTGTSLKTPSRPPVDVRYPSRSWPRRSPRPTPPRRVQPRWNPIAPKSRPARSSRSSGGAAFAVRPQEHLRFLCRGNNHLRPRRRRGRGPESRTILQPALFDRRRRPREDPFAPRHRPARHRIRRSARVAYVSTERFTNEFIDALQNSRVDAVPQEVSGKRTSC